MKSTKKTQFCSFNFRIYMFGSGIYIFQFKFKYIFFYVSFPGYELLERKSSKNNNERESVYQPPIIQPL